MGPIQRRPARSTSILIAEDDDASRRALRDALESMGYECRSARDGQEAWEMHEADPADVIIADWGMPRMDGLELCRKTRSHAYRYTYFIFLTSYGDKAHFLKGMEAGADDYLKKPVDLDELEARLASAERVVQLYRRLAEHNAALRRDSHASFVAARVDTLTRVGNRLRLDEDLRVFWSRAVRQRHRYCLSMIDIDEFKKYNDRFGHIAGDAVLKQVATTIRDRLREGDTVYRYGGEEFVVVLPGSLAEAANAMERVRRDVEQLGVTTSNDGVVTISAGLAELDLSRDRTPREWLERADSALYRAKHAGRNRVEIANGAKGGAPAASVR